MQALSPTDWNQWLNQLASANTRESQRHLFGERFRFFSAKKTDWNSLSVMASLAEERGQPLAAGPAFVPGPFAGDPFVLCVANALNAGTIFAQTRRLRGGEGPIEIRVRAPHPGASATALCADVVDVSVDANQKAQLQIAWAQAETPHPTQVSWTRVRVGRDATLQLMLDTSSVSGGDRVLRMEVILEQGAQLQTVSLHGGASRTQFQVDVSCEGSQAEWTWKSASRIEAERFVELQIRGCHAVPNTKSRLDSYMILADRSRGVFRGSLAISPEGVKTQAEQRSRALLLSKQAVFDALPDLEIATDDVQCAHGASVAPVDETQVFYLASRGIARDVATQMLVDAFVQPVLRSIEVDAWRERAERRFGMVKDTDFGTGGDREST